MSLVRKLEKGIGLWSYKDLHFAFSPGISSFQVSDIYRKLLSRDGKEFDLAALNEFPQGKSFGMMYFNPFAIVDFSGDEELNLAVFVHSFNEENSKKVLLEVMTNNGIAPYECGTSFIEDLERNHLPDYINFFEAARKRTNFKIEEFYPLFLYSMSVTKRKDLSIEERKRRLKMRFPEFTQ